MIHAMFQDHRTSGSGEEDFYHIWAWQPSWSCDLEHLYKVSFSFPKKAPHLPRRLQLKFGIDWPCGFRGEDV